MTSLASLLGLINYGFVLFFGIVMSLYLADIHFEDNKLPYIITTLALGAVQLLSYLMMGENLLYKCYPLLIHLPLVLLIRFAFHRNIYIATISVLSAYLMCTPRKWFGTLAASFFDDSPVVANLVSICVTIPLLYLVIRYIAPYIIRLHYENKKTLLLFFLLPLSYYILEYTLTVYTDLLYTGGPVIIDFMDSFLVLFFFILAMVSLDFSNKKSTAERENLLLTTAAAQAQKEIAQLKDFVARNKARVSTRNMAMSRQKKLDKMDVIELAAEKPKPEFNFRYGRTPGKMLFETHDLVIGYTEPLSKPLNFTMERGQKIALVGTNGIGKTTLLRSLLGLIKPLSGSVEQGENLAIGYFEQEVKGENRTTCIEELWQEFPSFSQYEIRSALAKCGLTTKHIESQVRVLSGGEQAKVRLCKLVNRDTNILLLDEPTNHLDVDAKDELKKALKEYRGSLLLICHEPEFYQDVVNEVWDMSRWTTKIF